MNLFFNENNLLNKKFLIFSFALISFLLISVSYGLAAETNYVTAGPNNPAASTQYNVSNNVPALQLNITNAESTDGDTITQVNIAVQYSGTGAANDYQVAVFNDADNDGIVSYGDTALLSYTTITADDGNTQLLDITDLDISANATGYLLFLLKTATTDPTAGDTVALDIANVTTDVLMTTAPTGGAAVTGNNITITNTAPAIAIANGTNNPASVDIKNDKSDHVMEQIKFTESGGTIDHITSIALTPVGDLAENADITTAKIYYDANGDGAVDAGDTQLLITPTQFTDDVNTKTTFTITGGVKISASGSTNILVVLDMAGTATDAETHSQNIAAASDVVLGSGETPTGTAGSNTTTIDTTGPLLGAMETYDIDADGYIETFNITFDEVVYVTGGLAGDATFDSDTFTTCTFTSFIYVSGNGTTKLVVNATTDSAGYDTGETGTILYNTAAGSIVDDAGNEAQDNDASDTSTDKAKPVVVTALTQDLDADATMDAVKITFSENIDDTTIVSGTSIQLRAENNTVYTESAFNATCNGDTVDNTIVYIEYTDGTADDTSDLIEYNITIAVSDLTGNNITAVSWASCTDGAAPQLLTRVGIDISGHSAPNEGYLTNTTGTIVMTFSESLNQTYSNSSERITEVTSGFNSATIDGATGSDDTKVNLTANTALTEQNYTFQYIVEDDAGNSNTETTSIYVDATAPYILYAGYIDTGYDMTRAEWTTSKFTADTDDKIRLIFSENMVAKGTALGNTTFILYNSTGQTAAGNDAFNSSDTVAVDGTDLTIVDITLAGAPENLLIRGSDTSLATSILEKSGDIESTNTVTDTAGMFMTNVSESTVDIADRIISITNNTWTGISVPFVIDTDQLDTDLTGYTVTMYTYYNDEWLSKTTDDVTPFEGYFIKIISSSDSTIYMPIHTEAYNTSAYQHPGSRTLYEGWNLVGYNTITGNTAADDMTNAATDYLYSVKNYAPILWNATTGSDMTQITITSPSANDARPFDPAYWLFVDRDCEWTGVSNAG